MINVATAKHPDYRNLEASWEKWRKTYDGGPDFVAKYLETFSARELTADFNVRKRITPCAAFAKAAINDIKNAIFQRIPTVTREGGPVSWMKACQGKGLGVDLKGSTMNSFIGRRVLVELLTMAKVGIFVDRQPLPETVSLADRVPSPYLSLYKAEDIMSWAYRQDGSPWEFQSLLLRDQDDKVDPELGLPTGIPVDRYKLFQLTPDGVVVRFFDKDGDEDRPQMFLKIKKIPFVVAGITDSLLKDVADHQIALMNMESSDIAFILKGNFPFYTEQQDKRGVGDHLKKKGSADQDSDDLTDDNITAGAMHGRRYPRNTDRPGFIAPPTDPLMAAMKKEEQLKRDIRILVNLGLAQIQGTMASAESKNMDQKGLEAGLSYVGMELEHAERRIAAIWAEYEGVSDQPTVQYPQRYSLKSDADLMQEAKDLEDRMMAIPSDTYKREIAKKIAETMLGPDLSLEQLQKIYKEIDDAEILTTDPDVIYKAIENVVLSPEGAAKALGIPKSEVDKAAKAHAERAATILAQQQKVNPAARGVDELDPDPQSGKVDKADVDPTEKKEVRGEGK